MPKQKRKDKHHKLTLDDLARMVQEGFSQTASDIGAFKVELAEDMNKLEARFENRMYALHQDLKHDLTPLKEKVPNVEADIIEHERRIKALERHAGIDKE